MNSRITNQTCAKPKVTPRGDSSNERDEKGSVDDMDVKTNSFAKEGKHYGQERRHDDGEYGDDDMSEGVDCWRIPLPPGELWYTKSESFGYLTKGRSGSGYVALGVSTI